MAMSKDEIKAVKQKALNEFKQERAEELIEDLKALYEKEAKAEEVLANIRREIADYEMRLEGK